jgi:hypothetical protein
MVNGGLIDPPAYEFRRSLLHYMTHDEVVACMLALRSPIILKDEEVFQRERTTAMELLLAELTRRKRLCGFAVREKENDDG